MDAHSLDALVKRCRSGDVDAYDELMDCLYPGVFALAFRLLSDRDDAEDATQEILVKIWRSLPRFQGRSQFTTWVYSIALHHCYDATRRRMRDRHSLQRLFDNLTGKNDHPVSPPPSLSDLYLAVEEAVRGLPDKLKVMVDLHYFTGHSVPQIAGMLGIPERTARYRLASALRRLEEQLKNLEDP